MMSYASEETVHEFRNMFADESKSSDFFKTGPTLY